MEFRNELVPFLKKNNITFDSLKSELLVTSKNIKTECNKCYGVLLIYSDHCGHCINFKPEYVKLYNLIKEYNESSKSKNKIKIFIMDANDKTNLDLLNKYNIRGVPTIIFITPSMNFTIYDSQRIATNIWNDFKKIIQK